MVLVNRIESISQYTKQNPQHTFYQILEYDMNTDIEFYLIFFIIFTLWMFYKTGKLVQEKRNYKTIIKSLENIEGKLGQNEQLGVGLINKEIQDNLKRIKEKRKL